MQFGLFYEWPNPTLRQWKTLFEEGVEQIQYSEALCFDYCLIAEHHFSNYGHSPAPLMQALYIGQRTKRLKIGTAAVILPVWQPLRLAEEVARTGVPRILRSADRDVAVISPAPPRRPRTGRSRRAPRHDALWDIVGIADAADFPDVPEDVSTNKHSYLADAYDDADR